MTVIARNVLAGFTLALASAPEAFGGGFRLFDQDAFATSRGGAFVATADNAAAVFYNPAGILQLSAPQTDTGTYFVSVNVDYDSLVTNAHTENKTRALAVPHFYFATPISKSSFAIGLGVYSTYGLGLTYPDDAPFRNAAKQAQIIHGTFNPVIAWQATASLGISVGPTWNFSKAKLIQGIAVQGDSFKFAGVGDDFGFTAGLLWKPHLQHSFGVSFHSASDISYSGHTDITLKPFVPLSDVKIRLPQEDANATVHFPAFLLAGYSYRPTPDWNIECGVDWTDWDSLNTVRLHQQRSPDVLLPFEYQSSFVYRFGVTRILSQRLLISGGYEFAENSVPTATFSPVVPDNDRHVFTIGIGGKCSAWHWNAAYQFAYQPTRTVDSRSPAAGRYQLAANALIVSAGVTF